MKRSILFCTGALMLVAAACDPIEDPNVGPPASDACGAAGYQSLVGAPLAAASLPADLGARIIHPDTMVTMDYREDRLNIRVNDAGRITEVYCG
ncbi:I78 family peptidase inhibitor [Mesobaculum littorinae]|nr:I78 family peptidase inhibitor [Mesobaculum littorinae]